MFVYGGILKLLGDLAALVGPVSITRIVKYIQVNLEASVVSAAATAGENARINITHASSKARSGMTGMLNNVMKTRSVGNYETASAEPGQLMSTLMINENSELYYPSWWDFAENGWIMALLVLIATLAQGSFSQASTHIVNMIGIRLRTSLQSLVYRKTLLISTSCFSSPNDEKTTDSNDHENNSASISDTNEILGTNNETDENTTNENIIDLVADTNDAVDKSVKPEQRQEMPEQTVDSGSITNLMSEDALNVMSFFWIAHYVWAIPLKVRFHLVYYELRSWQHDV